jgi:hypothetical protein
MTVIDAPRQSGSPFIWCTPFLLNESEFATAMQSLEQYVPWCLPKKMQAYF